jgi:Superinfection immunity protein/Protein of unknown function (DUF2510)
VDANIYGPDAFVLLLIIIFGAAIYFLPSIVAVARHAPDLGAVIVINLFLGWSLIGWVVAFALALRAHPRMVVFQAPFYSGPYFPPPTSPAAGWYLDPAGSGRLRYWDGQGWTRQLH